MLELPEYKLLRNLQIGQLFKSTDFTLNRRAPKVDLISLTNPMSQ